MCARSEGIVEGGWRVGMAWDGQGWDERKTHHRIDPSSRPQITVSLAKHRQGGQEACHETRRMADPAHPRRAEKGQKGR